MISKSEYQVFKTLFKNGAFENLTFGRAFCNHFDIQDDKLATEENPEKADKMIVLNHLDWS